MKKYLEIPLFKKEKQKELFLIKRGMTHLSKKNNTNIEVHDAIKFKNNIVAHVVAIKTTSDDKRLVVLANKNVSIEEWKEAFNFKDLIGLQNNNSPSFEKKAVRLQNKYKAKVV